MLEIASTEMSRSSLESAFLILASVEVSVLKTRFPVKEDWSLNGFCDRSLSVVMMTMAVASGPDTHSTVPEFSLGGQLMVRMDQSNGQENDSESDGSDGIGGVSVIPGSAGTGITGSAHSPESSNGQENDSEKVGSDGIGGVSVIPGNAGIGITGSAHSDASSNGQENDSEKVGSDGIGGVSVIPGNAGTGIVGSAHSDTSAPLDPGRQVWRP